MRSRALNGAFPLAIVAIPSLSSELRLGGASPHLVLGIVGEMTLYLLDFRFRI